MNQQNGGPAFPPVHDPETHCFGMSLRDYFAAKALAAMLGNSDKEGANRGAQGLKVFPTYAYEWADAMLSERAKARGEQA